MPEKSRLLYSKPLALTYGDPDGIGLEILNYLIAKRILPKRSFIVFGDPRLVKLNSEYKSLIDFYFPESSFMNAGKHSFECLKWAAENCLQGECVGLITGPISKEKWAQAGFKYKGQTEFLGEITQSKPEMLFIAQDWRILLLTRHIPLRQVPEALTYDRFEQAQKILKDFLKQKYQIENPLIAVAGLNPHAGENGEIGQEEKLCWQNWCSELGLCGPFSADDVWLNSAKAYMSGQKQKYDAYLAPYHDQVLPLIKTITNFQAVNVSIGLPFIRTSPDHGTAFNLVGTGQADHKPFLEAIKLCMRLTF